MGEADAGCDFEGVLPAGVGLIGEAGDEVGADVVEARGLEAKDLLDAVAFGVGAADGGALAIDEGLDAEADAVDSVELGCGEDGVGDLAGGGFEGDFCVGGEGEVAMQRREDAFELSGLKQAGSSSAEVDGVDSAGEIARVASRQLWLRNRSPGRAW